jgi:phage shock protein PspC (stress-responsive transcriptional regulator)
MWAGVAGGMAEYFDLDPSLVRLIWVAAAVVTHGLAIPLYILAWIILPRDDRSPAAGQAPWRDWSQEFHAETQRLAEEARRVATEFQGPSSTTSTPSTTSAETASTAEPQPATDKSPASAPSAPWTSTTSTPSEPLPTWSATTTPPEPAPSWSTPTDLDEPRRGGQPRTVGVVLVGLGAFLLAANAGWFAWVNWGSMWPLIFIGLGVLLLARQFDWWGR